MELFINNPATQLALMNNTQTYNGDADPKVLIAVFITYNIIALISLLYTIYLYRKEDSKWSFIEFCFMCDNFIVSIINMFSMVMYSVMVFVLLSYLVYIII